MVWTIDDIESDAVYCDYTVYAKDKRIKKYGDCTFQSRKVALAERFGDMRNVFDHKKEFPTVTSLSVWLECRRRHSFLLLTCVSKKEVRLNQPKS